MKKPGIFITSKRRNMKKFILTFFTAAFITAGVKAQTIQEGVNHLYADRFKSAISVFEKLLATNPNNIEAIYWLGQVYFDMDDNAKAKEIYSKALASNGSAPLILVGLGHVDLLENKVADAKQKFESALTASRTKKGDDPMVLTAIGRANVDAKAGDAAYAVQKLEAADQKNTETLLQLGNAYRKANPGQGGGQAFETYKKALSVNPTFAVANLRMAKLFESQKNWEFVLQYLNEAIKADPKFAPAYYELFYYYFYRGKFPEAEEQLTKYIANSDPEIQHDFLYAQLMWAKKDFAAAISKAEAVAAAAGPKTKPKVYKLLADAYFNSGDYANAKKNIDLYFAKEKPDQVIAMDYKLKADILDKTGGTPEEVMNTYLTGVDADTVVNSKIDFMKQGIAYFKDKKLYNNQATLIQKLISLKPKPNLNDYFDLTIAYYFDKDYPKAREEALGMIQKYPDQVYGYEWAYNVAIAVDTLKKDSIAFQDASALWAFAEKDTAKYRKQYISSVRYLAAYYINKEKNKEKALEFFNKWLEADPANAETISGYIEQIKKMPGGKTGTRPSGNPPPPKPNTKATQPVKTTTSSAIKNRQ
jgi:tetratricopeptide (TPR) repeat protein